MKYTVLAFQLHESELVDGLQRPNSFSQLLNDTAKHRAEIVCGVYVFDTQKGWSDMNRLRTYLIERRQTFVELPFEQALAGFFPDDVCDKLREIGKSSGQEISLLNLNPRAKD